MNNQSLASRIRAFFSISIISCSAFCISACSSSGGSASYTVGGTVTGTSGSGLVLQLNAANDINMSGDGNFTFTTTLTSGSSYSVTTLSSPTGQTCRVSNGSGTLSANVTNVGVECRTNEDPNGYYTDSGSAIVGDGSTGILNISDLQAIIYDNRFMASSVSNGLLYDGPLEMFGDELTATVSVYRDGLLIYSNVNLTATVIANDSISGTLGGAQEGLGTFTLQHSLDATTASISRVLRDITVDPAWMSTLADSTTNTAFFLSNAAEIQPDAAPSDGNMTGCALSSHFSETAVIPIAGTSLYRITVQLILCTDTDQTTNIGTAGLYTGFATSRTDSATDDTFVFLVSSTSGDYAVAEDFK